MTDLFASGKPLIAIVHFGSEERDRFPPLRLRALLAETILQGGEFCLINAADCDVEMDRIGADVWIDGAFQQRQIARPDVAVIPARPTLRRHLDIRDWMRSKCPTVEDIGPDKADLPVRLSDTPLRKYLLPQRIIAPDEDVAQAVEDWLRKVGSAVIKPADGNRGRGIQFILPQADDWTHRADQESWTGSLQEVSRRAAQTIEGRTRYRRYILQKYVKSVTPDGRAFYIRFDVHKDGTGDWRVVKSGARIGEIGFSVGNPTNGGYGGDIAVALEQRRCRRSEEIRDEAESLTLELGRTLDRFQDFRIKELGVDMVLDESDAIWLIEANIQPQSSGHNLERARVNVDYCLAIAKGTLKLNFAG